MSSIIRFVRERPGLAVFALGFLLRAAWVYTLDDVLLWPDEQEFAAVAGHIAAGEGYVSSSYRANPVVPFYLSLFFGAFGQTYLLARLGQAVLGALTCTLLHRLTARLAGWRAGLAAGTMLAVYPAHIYLAGVFYVTCIATFLSVLAVELVVIAGRARSPLRWALGAGAVIGLAALTRATFLVYVPAACISLVWADPARWRRLVPAAVALGTVAVLVIAPWCVRNSMVFGQPMLISSGLWETLWKGTNEVADGGSDDRNMAWATPLWESRLARMSHAERDVVVARYERIAADVYDSYQRTGDIFLSRDEVLRPIVIEYIGDNPGRFARLFGAKLATLFQAFSDTEKSNEHTSRDKRLIAAVTFYPVLALSLLGLILSAPEHRSYAPAYLMVIGFSLLYGLLTACTRFRLPLDPFLMVFAAVALDRLYAGVAHRVRQALPAEGTVHPRGAKT